MRSSGRAVWAAAGSAGLSAASLASLAVAVGMTAAPAQAEVKDVQPYFVTVQRDNTPLKCSAGAIYYAVRVLKAGEVLRVDGEDQGWLRAEYLPGMRAFVKADEATLSGSLATLKAPSRLNAANIASSERGNWWPLLDSGLPAGTALKVVQQVKMPDGTVTGYLVEAPVAARGYVSTDMVRRSTEAEASEFKGVKAASAAPAGSAATVATPAAQPATAVATGQPTRVAPGESTHGGGEPSGQPVADLPGAGQPGVTAVASAESPVVVASGETTPGRPQSGQPAAGEPVQPLVVAAPPEIIPVQDLERLRELFENVMRDQGEAETQTVVAEFNRKIASLGSGPVDQQIKRGLEQRLEAIKLRAEVQQEMKRLRESRGGLDAEARRVAELVDAVERQSIYTIVGRIVPSTVYDGQRGMPLMYRIESADASSTRTLGYVVPREGVDMLTKLGKVAGIVGESRYDESLGLNIVSPRRVDALTTVRTARGLEGRTAPGNGGGSSGTGGTSTVGADPEKP